jgi:hypothetical protein
MAPVGLALTSDQRQLYVTDYQAHNIRVIDLGSKSDINLTLSQLAHFLVLIFRKSTRLRTDSESTCRCTHTHEDSTKSF